MRLFNDLSSEVVSKDIYVGVTLSTNEPVIASLGDGKELEIMFHRGGTAELLDDPILVFVAKVLGDYSGAEIILCDSFTSPGDTTGYYTGTLDFDQVALRHLFIDGDVGETAATQVARYALTGKAVGYIVYQSDNHSYWSVIDADELDNADGWEEITQSEYVDLGAEIVRRVSPAYTESTSRSFILRVYNDYLKGSETSPAAGAPFTRGFVLNRYDITALTGGAATALDAIATADQLVVGSLVAVDVDDAPWLWRLRQLVISGITVAAAAVVTTTRKHGLTTGQTVAIGGTDSTPTLDGNRVVTVLSDTTFSVPVTTTVAGDAGYAAPAENAAAGLVRPDDFDAADNNVFWQSRA